MQRVVRSPLMSFEGESANRDDQVTVDPWIMNRSEATPAPTRVFLSVAIAATLVICGISLAAFGGVAKYRYSFLFLTPISTHGALAWEGVDPWWPSRSLASTGPTPTSIAPSRSIAQESSIASSRSVHCLQP